MQCHARVMKKDQLRVCRDGSGRRFKMHFNEVQCSRAATVGNRCKQHSTMTWVPDYRWVEVEIQHNEREDQADD